MTAEGRRPRSTRIADAACIAAVSLSQIWAVVSVAFTAALIGTHPIALEAINGGVLAVAAGGAFARVGRASVLVCILAPLPVWLPLDASAWWAGRRFGPPAISWLAARHARIQRALPAWKRAIDRHRFAVVALAPWLPVPAAVLFAVSGWRRFPLPMFVAADAVGSVARDGISAAVGYGLGDSAVSVTRQISQVAGVVTAALVVSALALLGTSIMRTRRRGRGSAGAASENLGRNGQA